MRAGRRLLAGLVLLGIWTLAVRILWTPPRLEVEVEMASEVTGRLQVYADDGRGFRHQLSDRAPVMGNGRFATYLLTLAPRGALRALRLDPADGPGRLTIRAVTVSIDGRSERFEGSELVAWKSAELRQEGSGWRSLGADPRLVLRRQWATPWRSRLVQPTSTAELAFAAAALPLLVLALVPGLGRRTAGALALASPLALFLALNARALGSWWIHDDPCLLAAAAGGGIGPHFWHPETWRALSGTVLMPWTILSLGLDAALFGLEPAPLYAHQLLSFTVLLAFVHGVLRGRLSPWSSALATSLFAVSAPAFAVAQQLMNRHYLEGTILFLGALALYWRAVRTHRPALAVAGAGLYLLSVTAKEVFVPLVVLLPWLPVGDWRARWRQLAPFAAAAALYVPWRLYMLGPSNSFSGYAARPGAGLGEILSVPAIVGLADGWQLALAAAVAALAVLAVLRRARHWLGPLVAAGVALALPLVPVAGELGPRHFLLPALGAGVVVAAALEPWLRQRPVARAAAGLALLVFAFQTLAASPIWRRHGEAMTRHRAEGTFVLDAAAEGVLLSRLDDPNYLACVAELRRDAAGTGAGPGFCGDACYCAAELPGAAFRRVAGEAIESVEPPLDAACAVERELAVEMRYDAPRGRLGWRFGPHAGGLYELLMVTGDEPPEISAPVPITAAGEAPLTLREPFRAVVGYRSPERWRTFSPVLALDPTTGGLQWRRLRYNDVKPSFDDPPSKEPQE